MIRLSTYLVTIQPGIAWGSFIILFSFGRVKEHFLPNIIMVLFRAIVIFMVFLGTVNVGNIVAPEVWRQSPIAERIVSNSTTSSSNSAEGAEYPATNVQE
jgi:hypothetical protein